MNANFNITSIIRASFDAENIRVFLDHGKKLGFKYYETNSDKPTHELTIEQILANIKARPKQSKIEILTKTNSIRFFLAFESSYSSKANELGLGCSFRNIDQDINSKNSAPNKVECISLILKLIADYFIFELHAQEGKYISEDDY